MTVLHFQVVGCDVLYYGNVQNDADLDARFPGKLLCLHCDVSKADQLRRVFEVTKEKHGRVDVVVNNAGVVQENDLDTAIDVNLKGVIHGTRLGMEYMSKTNGGKGGDVIELSSMAAFVAIPFFPVYTATKSAILQYVRSLVSDKKHASTGVRINCICPTMVKTRMLELNPGQLEGSEESIQEAAADMPPLMQPSGVAQAVWKLLEDERDLQGCSIFVNDAGYRIEPFENKSKQTHQQLCKDMTPF